MVQLIREMSCQTPEYLLRPGARGVTPYTFELIGFGFGCITVFVHLLVLVIIFIEIRYSNRVNNSFYIICFTLGIVDLLCLISNQAMYSFPRWHYRFLREMFVDCGEFIVRTGFFITWGVGLWQVCLTLLMTTNRFTALAFPCRHDFIWKNRNIAIVLGITLVTAFLVGSPTLYTPVCIVEADTGEMYGRIIKSTVLQFLYCVAGLFLIASTSSMLVMYGIIFKRLSGRRRKQQNHKVVIIGSNFVVRAVVQRRRETKLLAMACIVCLIQTVITCFVIVKFIFDYDPLNFWYNQMNTFYSSVNSYLLIIFSDLIRKRIYNVFIGSWRPSSKANTTTFIIHYSKQKI